MQCRCCLSRQLPLFELFELKLDVVLTSLASVLIERNDGLPAFACEECVGKAKASLRFKRRCERVDQSMRRLLGLSRQACETEQSDRLDDGAEANQKEAANMPADGAADDQRSPRPSDHDYYGSFDPESVEMLDECLEQEEEQLLLEEEVLPDRDTHDPPGEQLDDMDRDNRDAASKGSTEATGSGTEDDNSAVLCIESVHELIEEEMLQEKGPPDLDDLSTSQRTESRPETSSRGTASPASLQAPGPKRRRGFSRSIFMKQHAVQCASRKDPQRGFRRLTAVLRCELCRKTFRSQPMLWRHRQNCKGMSDFDFIRDVVDHYTDKEFRTHFRMTRTTADSLVDSYERSEFYRVRVTGGRPEIPARTQILSFLWFCGTRTTFQKVCRLFQVGLASFHKHMALILDFLHQMARDVIKLPGSSEEKEQLSLQLAKIIPMTNVLGCIDSWFIDCVRHKEANAGPDPVENATRAPPANLRNPGGGILLQAIGDPSGKFMDVHTELMLSTELDDGRTFVRSALAPRLDSASENGRFHLLGSSPYPLRPYLLTPFATGSSDANSNLPANDPHVTAYNSTLHVALENTILKAFRALRRRFPVLVKLRFFSPEKVGRFVLACCVLHNVCIDAGDMPMTVDADRDEDDDLAEGSDEAPFSATRFWQRPYCERSAEDVEGLYEAGKVKRDQISMSLVA